MRKSIAVTSNPSSANTLDCAAAKCKNLKSITVLLLLIAVIVVFGSGVWEAKVLAESNAGAAFGVWPDTGQDKCYSYSDTEIPCPSEGEPFYGQDAQYQGPKRSYTKLGYGGIELPDSATPAEGWIMTRDNVTGLIWEIKTDDGTIHDKNNRYVRKGIEQNFIASLNSDQFGGYSDWRLPTIKELSTLLDSSISAPGPKIDTNYFPNTMQGIYWSSTGLKCLTTELCVSWTVYFDYGLVTSPTYGSDHYVRAVRGGSQPLSLNSFIDNNDGTITDTKTGLMWQKCSMGQTYNPSTNGCEGSEMKYKWQQALEVCEKFNFAGYDDWRLPNRNELQSIVDYSKIDTTNDRAAIDTNYFPVSDQHFNYISSTTVLQSPSEAWYLDLGPGLIKRGGKNAWWHVRAVRLGASRVELGDVSGDGQLNIVDALFVARYAVGLPVSNFNANAADVNCDNQINIVDALLIARKIVGLPVNGWCASSI